MPLKYLQILILGSIFLLHYVIEHLHPQQKHINNWKNEQFNIVIGIFNVVLNFIPATLLINLLQLINSNHIGLFQAIEMNKTFQFFITTLSLDLWMYTWHRLNHTLPFLWRWHRFHHTDRKMNTTTAVRFHIFELFLSVPSKAVIYILLGPDINTVLIYEMLFFTAVVFHHSNIYITEKFDRLYRVLFASPNMHRIHHSDEPRKQHSNYGAVFSFWDKLFNSWTKPIDEKIHFGLNKDQL